MAKTVLIIEDSLDIGGSLKILIELEGYNAVVAQTALDGRDKALEIRPDLILMDLALPDLDGIELTKELRTLPETADIPIICVSSYTGRFGSEVNEAGCNEMFSKTSFMTSYVSTLKKYLG